MTAFCYNGSKFSNQWQSKDSFSRQLTPERIPVNPGLHQCAKKRLGNWAVTSTRREGLSVCKASVTDTKWTKPLCSSSCLQPWVQWPLNMFPPSLPQQGPWSLSAGVLSRSGSPSIFMESYLSQQDTVSPAAEAIGPWQAWCIVRGSPSHCRAGLLCRESWNPEEPGWGHICIGSHLYWVAQGPVLAPGQGRRMETEQASKVQSFLIIIIIIIVIITIILNSTSLLCAQLSSQCCACINTYVS